ncbi:hypothetical protein ACFP6A_05370 [Quadrisphaera sp. GCM10027208]|uniref:hypothetical protein n=1 Tax=Quadrisphaera sp. GCM10027208 TaxID=3273423 RepID=UPI00361BCC3A
MSDLQCPARFLLVPDGTPTSVDLGPTDPWAQLEALADLHRGETVVVRVPADVAAALPDLLRAPGVVEVDADGWRRVGDVPE